MSFYADRFFEKSFIELIYEANRKEIISYVYIKLKKYIGRININLKRTLYNPGFNANRIRFPSFVSTVLIKI